MTEPMRPVLLAVLVAAALAAAPASANADGTPQLLFRVSADKDFAADHAEGEAVPNFQDRVKIVPTGVQGGAIEWADDGVLAWNAPGNIFAERGTLSRSLDPDRQLSHRLGDVCARYSIPLDRPHDAMADAVATAAVLPYLLKDAGITTREQLLAYSAAAQAR